MMSPETIRSLSRDAAAKAAREHKAPFIVWPEDLNEWKAKLANGQYPSFPFPFIGDYKPRGFRKVNEYFVDSSGFGAPGEPALTVSQFLDKLRSGYGYAITEIGQFQLYVGEYRKAKARVSK